MKIIGSNTTVSWLLFGFGTILGLVGFGNLTTAETISFSSVVITISGLAAIVFLVLQRRGAILASGLVVLFMFLILIFDIVSKKLLHLSGSKLENVTAITTIVAFLLLGIYFLKRQKVTVADIKRIAGLSFMFIIPWVLLVTAIMLVGLGLPKEWSPGAERINIPFSQVALIAIGFLMLLFLAFWPAKMLRITILRIIVIALLAIISPVIFALVLKGYFDIYRPRLEVLITLFMQAYLYGICGYLLTRPKLLKIIGIVFAPILLLASLYAMLNLGVYWPKDAMFTRLLAVFPFAFGVFLIMRRSIVSRLLGIGVILLVLYALFISIFMVDLNYYLQLHSTR